MPKITKLSLVQDEILALITSLKAIYMYNFFYFLRSNTINFLIVSIEKNKSIIVKSREVNKAGFIIDVKVFTTIYLKV